MTKVRLTGDVEMTINGSLEDVLGSFKAALVHGVPWEIRGPDGQAVALNPHHVLFIEAVTTDDSFEPLPSAARRLEPAGAR